MDRSRRPFVHLHLQADVMDTDFLAICGGNNIYAPAAALDDSYLNYYDATQGDDILALEIVTQGLNRVVLCVGAGQLFFLVCERPFLNSRQRRVLSASLPEGMVQ